MKDVYRVLVGICGVLLIFAVGPATIGMIARDERHAGTFILFSLALLGGAFIFNKLAEN